MKYALSINEIGRSSAVDISRHDVQLDLRDAASWFSPSVFPLPELLARKNQIQNGKGEVPVRKKYHSRLGESPGSWPHPEKRDRSHRLQFRSAIP